MEVLKLNILFYDAYELHLSIYESRYEAYEATEKYMILRINRGFTGPHNTIYANFESFQQSYERHKRNKLK